MAVWRLLIALRSSNLLDLGIVNEFYLKTFDFQLMANGEQHSDKRLRNKYLLIIADGNRF